MRTVDADLTAALLGHNYHPYAKIICQVDVGVYETHDAIFFELTGTKCNVKFEKQTYVDCLDFTIERGCIIDGVETGLTTSAFTPVNAKCENGIVTLHGDLFKRVLFLEIAGDASYDTVLDDVATEYGKTATFKDNTDAYWGYTFLPADTFVKINNPDHFIRLIRQKYLMFVTDNGGDDVLFFYAGKSLSSGSVDWNINPASLVYRDDYNLRNMVSIDEDGNYTLAYDAGTKYTYPRHNLGYINSADSMPRVSYPAGVYVYADMQQFKYVQRPDLRYQDGDSIYMSTTGVLSRIAVREIWDARRSPKWQQVITGLEYFTTTEGGNVGYTSAIEQPESLEIDDILAIAPYLPLLPGTFDNILSANDTHIQHAFDTLDEHNHDADYSPLVDDTPARYYLSADIANIPNACAARIDLDTELHDIGDNWLYADWYGQSGAYQQADAAGCNATTIKYTGANFISGMIGSYVKYSSDAAGTLNTGTAYVTARPDTNTLTILKATGANFANSYYFWIKKSFYVVPADGLYLICANIRIDPTEDQRRYNMAVYECSYNSIALGQDTRHASGTAALVSTYTLMAYLTAGQWIGLLVSATTLAATMTVKGGATYPYASYTSLSVARMY